MTERDFIMQMKPWIGDEERQALNSYMQEDGFLTEFKNTKKFEEAIEEFTGSKHCIVVNNGTISLTLAALALGIKPGDEVIVPNFTMVATPNSITMIGAKPVFVDISDDFIISTGKQYSVKQFVNFVLKELNLDFSWKGKGINTKCYLKNEKLPFIECDKTYFRPLEVDTLLGNSSKARKILNWKPKHNLQKLVKEMVNEELKDLY